MSLPVLYCAASWLDGASWRPSGQPVATTTNYPCSPLCIEEFDLSDRNFRPCPCGYQVCVDFSNDTRARLANNHDTGLPVLL